jgi:hypothetical protein
MWFIALLVFVGNEPVKDQVEQGGPTVDMVGERSEAQPVKGAAVPVQVVVRNDMGNHFRLVEARVVLDDTEVVHQNASGKQELEPSFGALETPVKPGPHALTATLVYEGRNTGPFSYLDNYRYKVQTTYPFELAEGGDTVAIQVVAHERQGANLRLENRPVLEVMAAPGSGVTPMPGVTQSAGRNIVHVAAAAQ